MNEADYKALDARISLLEEKVDVIYKASRLLSSSIKSIVQANRLMIADIEDLKAKSLS